MKARDLAALAALGIAGKYAYDKYNEKNEPKTRGKLGESQSANDDSAGEYRSDMLGKSRSANDGDVGNDADYVMPRTAPRQVAADDDYVMPRTAARQIAADDDYVMPRTAPSAVANNGFKKVKAASSGSLSSTGGPSRYNRAADSNAAGAVETGAVESDYQMPRTAPRTDLDRLNEANGAASASARATDALAVGSRANQAAYLQAKQADQMAAAASPSARATDALAVSSRANQAAYKQAQLAAQAANAQAQARMARQGSPMATARRNAGMPGYDEAGNPISMRSMAGQRGYDEAGRPMKRGGVVKMAKGGLASSKMSKPSGASRGDGIAQRGRTRGKYL